MGVLLRLVCGHAVILQSFYGCFASSFCKGFARVLLRDFFAEDFFACLSLCCSKQKHRFASTKLKQNECQNECLCMDQYEHRRPFCVRFGVQNESRTAATRVQNLGQIGQANLCKTNACGAICAGPGSYCLRLDLRARGARITERDTCCGVSTRLRLAGCPAPAGAVSDPSADSAL